MAQPALDPVLMQSQQADPQKIAIFAKRYPWLARSLGSPDALMREIDAVHARNSQRSPGSGSDLFAAQVASEALGSIYGINDYRPRGFMGKHDMLSDRDAEAQMLMADELRR